MVDFNARAIKIVFARKTRNLAESFERASVKTHIFFNARAVAATGNRLSVNR